jgi:hypothetical protein
MTDTRVEPRVRPLPANFLDFDPLPDFMLARLKESGDRLHARDTRLTESAASPDASFRLLVECWDNIACIGTLVRAYQEADRTNPSWTLLRRVILVLVQPYEQHPDFDRLWLTELGVLTKDPTAQGG